MTVFCGVGTFFAALGTGELVNLVTRFIPGALTFEFHHTTDIVCLRKTMSRTLPQSTCRGQDTAETPSSKPPKPPSVTKLHSFDGFDDEVLPQNTKIIVYCVYIEYCV